MDEKIKKLLKEAFEAGKMTEMCLGSRDAASYPDFEEWYRDEYYNTFDIEEVNSVLYLHPEEWAIYNDAYIIYTGSRQFHSWTGAPGTWTEIVKMTNPEPLVAHFPGKLNPDWFTPRDAVYDSEDTAQYSWKLMPTTSTNSEE